MLGPIEERWVKIIRRYAGKAWVEQPTNCEVTRMAYLTGLVMALRRLEPKGKLPWKGDAAAEAFEAGTIEGDQITEDRKRKREERKKAKEKL